MAKNTINLNLRCSFEPYFDQPELHCKPPFGLKPKRLCVEERISDIQQAINRFINARKPIPTEWTEEFNELIKKS